MDDELNSKATIDESLAPVPITYQNIMATSLREYDQRSMGLRETYPEAATLFENIARSNNPVMADAVNDTLLTITYENRIDKEMGPLARMIEMEVTPLSPSPDLIKREDLYRRRVQILNDHRLGIEERMLRMDLRDQLLYKNVKRAIEDIYFAHLPRNGQNNGKLTPEVEIDLLQLFRLQQELVKSTNR